MKIIHGKCLHFYSVYWKNNLQITKIPLTLNGVLTRNESFFVDPQIVLLFHHYENQINIETKIVRLKSPNKSNTISMVHFLNYNNRKSFFNYMTTLIRVLVDYLLNIW